MHAFGETYCIHAVARNQPQDCAIFELRFDSFKVNAYRTYKCHIVGGKFPRRHVLLRRDGLEVSSFQA